MTEVRSVGVVGAGTMGVGIAQVAAMAGCEVRLYDVADDALQRALSGLSRTLDGLVGRGKLAASEAASVRARITPTLDLGTLGGVDFVIEAAPEDLATKQRLFAQLDQLCPERVVLASNTSSLSITELGAATRHPERVVGMHFFNPAPVLPLVEVARGARSDRACIETTLELARRFGKTPVEVADTPGFIVNRVARPFYLEALRLLGEGLADAPTIDRIMRLAGFRMGPFELMDLIGIDVNFAVTESLYRQSFQDPRFCPHPIQRQLVRAGCLGRKSGRGFYVYSEDGTPRDGPRPTPPLDRPPEPIAVVGNGRLADALRTLTRDAGLALTERIEQAGLIVLPSQGLIEVRRLGLRDALRQSRDGVPILAHCAPYPVTEVAAFQRGVDRVVGFSIVGEPSAAPLMEVAGALNSSEAAVTAAMGYARALGKEPVRVGDGAGMVLLRLLSTLANEAALALDEGVATAEDIDRAMKLGVAYPHGPLEWADELGLDLVYQTLRALQQDYGPHRYPIAVRLRRLVQAGHTGRAGGRGFFDAARGSAS